MLYGSLFFYDLQKNIAFNFDTPLPPGKIHTKPIFYRSALFLIRKILSENYYTTLVIFEKFQTPFLWVRMPEKCTAQNLTILAVFMSLVGILSAALVEMPLWAFCAFLWVCCAPCLSAGALEPCAVSDMQTGAALRPGRLYAVSSLFPSVRGCLCLCNLKTLSAGVLWLCSVDVRRSRAGCLLFVCTS